MKLYLTALDELHVFELPQKIEGSFLFEFKIKNSNVGNSLSVDASQDRWILKSNGNVNICTTNGTLPSCILQLYQVVPLQLIGSTKLLYLYVLPDIDTTSFLVSTQGQVTITFGSANENHISYASQQIAPTQLNFTFQNNEWYLMVNQTQELLVYCNHRRVIKNIMLECGDIIFCGGVIFIWMRNFIKLTNPNQQIAIHGLQTFLLPKVDNTSYHETTEEEESVPLYTEENYFFHTPRLRTVLEEEEITIDPPPENQESNNDLPFLLSLGSSLTMMASSLMMGYNVVYNLSSGSRNFSSAIPSLVVCVAMIVGSVIMPRLIQRYQKKMRHQRELLRQKKYTEYIQNKEKKIQSIIAKQAQILTENNVSLEECSTIITTMNRNIWSREIEDNDFLTVRLGTGERPSLLTIKTPEEHFTLDDDNLRDTIYQLPNRYKRLERVPVTVSLLDNPLTAFICDCPFQDDYMNGIILQLITFHSALDLKIVLLTTEDNANRWSYVKRLPHCFNEDRSVRFFATNIQEVKTITSYLDKEYKLRQEMIDNHGKDSEIEEFDSKDSYKNFQPYYLIITDNYSEFKDIDFIKNYLKRSNNVGFSLLMIEKSMKNLPNECDLFVQVLESNSGVFNKELISDNQMQFQAEYNPLINMKEMARLVANIPIQSKEQAMSLPNSLSFLDIFNVGKIEQLNILNRWQQNNPVNSLACSIGVHSNGDPFELDLHEKVAGPHGLIAGSTGSGKSEFIITYILSMAINYRPDEVQFVLIDYKGGGLAGAFESRETGICIPHLAGTITNLDTSEMNRTLVSLDSELKRRQQKFNQAKEISGESTMDIYKYQRLYREGVIQEPISHLFVISDEFAELKAQQPDFMAQLITTARIGRSLGVHLILATQKPSGVVNDQIWSNSRFRVCLKVQTRADSNEMLKRPEAASLKETGRFYLQVGYDEYFDIGQAGWAGARYISTERIIKKTDNSINFIDDIGNIYRSVNDAKKNQDTENKGDQLTNIVKYLVELGEKENYTPKKLWLPALSDTIYLNTLEEKYSYQTTPYVICPLIGEYDAPANQIQGPCSIDITHTGNLMILGQGGSGKENLLTTFIYSIIMKHSPSEVNFYIADFGAETLKVFAKAPQVGDVFLLDEKDKLNNLVGMLQKELETRKKLFSDYAGNYVDYLKGSNETLPLLIVVLNGYEALMETYPSVVDTLTPLFRDSSKYGITFVVTGNSAGSIRSRISQNFANKICLQMPDDYDYRDVLGAPRGMIPATKFGRGIILMNDNTYEFQTSYICEKDKINQTIKSTIENLVQQYPTKAKKIPILPEIVTLDDVLFEMKDLKTIPIGIEMKSLEVFVYDFTVQPINLIASSHLENHIYFFYAIANEMLRLSNVSVEIIDVLGIFKQQYDNLIIITDHFNEYMEQLLEKLNSPTQSAENTVRIFLGISSLYEKLNDRAKAILNAVLLKSPALTSQIFIIADQNDKIKLLQPMDWYKANVDNAYGIWLGADVSVQLAISIVSLSFDDKKIMFPCIAYPVYKGYHMIIKYVVDGVGDRNE